MENMTIHSDLKQKACAIITGLRLFLSSRSASLWRPQVLAALVMGAILLLSFFSQARLILPLEKALFTSHVRSALDRVEDYTNVRSAIISAAAGTDNLADILNPAKLEAYLAVLQRRAPDLLSVEILNERGESQAMLGDLPTGRALVETTGSSAFPLKNLPENGRFIVDDERSGSLSLICAHQGTDGGRWFSRTRFSRGPFVQLFGLGGDYNSTIAPVMTAKTEDYGRETESSIHVPAGVVSGPVRADALVKNTNVALQVTRPGASILGRPLLWAPLALLCACYLTFAAVMRRRNPAACASDAQVIASRSAVEPILWVPALGGAAGSVSPAHDENPSPSSSGVLAESSSDYFTPGIPPVSPEPKSAALVPWANTRVSDDDFPPVVGRGVAGGSYDEKPSNTTAVFAEHSVNALAADDTDRARSMSRVPDEAEARGAAGVTSVEAERSFADADAEISIYDDIAEAIEHSLPEGDHSVIVCDAYGECAEAIPKEPAASEDSASAPPAETHALGSIPRLAAHDALESDKSTDTCIPTDGLVVSAVGSPFHSQTIPETLDVEWCEEIEAPPAESDEEPGKYIRLSSHFSF